MGRAVSRAYLDASAIIYSVEGVAPLRAKVLARIAAVEAIPEGVTITGDTALRRCTDIKVELLTP